MQNNIYIGYQSPLVLSKMIKLKLASDSVCKSDLLQILVMHFQQRGNMLSQFENQKDSSNIFGHGSGSSVDSKKIEGL